MFIVDKKGGYWAISPTFLHYILAQINVLDFAFSVSA